MPRFVYSDINADTTAVNTGSDTIATIEVPTAHTGIERPHTPLHSNGAMGLVLTGLFLVLVSYSSGYKYISNLWHNMFKVKMRDFEDHTVDETRILTALISNTCITMGLMMFYAVSYCHNELIPILQRNITGALGAFIGIAVVYYFSQLALYNLLAYVFGDKQQSVSLLNGFKATQSLLGLLLLPLVVIILVNPQSTAAVLIATTAIYISIRIILISKGFRIFYTDFRSTIYFILYLCAVEIVPLCIIWAGTIYLCSNFLVK